MTRGLRSVEMFVVNRMLRQMGGCNVLFGDIFAVYFKKEYFGFNV